MRIDRYTRILLKKFQKKDEIIHFAFLDLEEGIVETWCTGAASQVSQTGICDCQEVYPHTAGTPQPFSITVGIHQKLRTATVSIQPRHEPGHERSSTTDALVVALADEVPRKVELTWRITCRFLSDRLAVFELRLDGEDGVPDERQERQRLHRWTVSSCQGLMFSIAGLNNYQRRRFVTRDETSHILPGSSGEIPPDYYITGKSAIR